MPDSAFSFSRGFDPLTPDSPHAAYSLMSHCVNHIRFFWLTNNQAALHGRIMAGNGTDNRVLAWLIRHLEREKHPLARLDNSGIVQDQIAVVFHIQLIVSFQRLWLRDFILD
jgi:hypothetical protein